MAFDKIQNVRQIRHELNMNQLEFWEMVGVTQSGGSRYESGRNMPRPVRELVRIVHVEKIDLSTVKGNDFEIVQYIKDTHPDLYQSLRKSVQQSKGEK